MKKMTCYIIDDEYLAREILVEYISKVSFLELKGSFTSPLKAVEKLEVDKPDLLFLDINMPIIDGISFISMLNPKPWIILTTAYEQYAVKAFALEVKDYLVKPFSFERFYAGVLRLYQEKNIHVNSEKPVIKESKSTKEFIFVKVGGRIQRIIINEILFIEGMRDYLRIHTMEEKLMTLSSFSDVEKILPSNQFVRVHRSFIVALNKIEHVERNRIKIKEELIPIGAIYRDSFFKILSG